jgi:hypothetical protein
MELIGSNFWIFLGEVWFILCSLCTLAYINYPLNDMGKFGFEEFLWNVEIDGFC